jgi:energy-coupling factor transporter ATP-binding protein EcfA2
VTLREQILLTLADVGFRTGEGPLAPLDNPLPLVTGWAVDDTTASLAVVVEDPKGVTDEDPWRELLFALSGIRHEVRDGGSAAIGTPVAIAILASAEEGKRLRRLIEDVSVRYVLFSRVELSVVLEDEGEAGVARALAPLLPACRRALSDGIVIGNGALQALADELRQAITTLAAALDPALNTHARAAADDFAEQLGGLVLNGAAANTFNPVAWSTVALENFRSFAAQDVRLGTLTLLEGLNGTGKSSLVEALEILWAGTSQRKPVDEAADAYDRHLSRDGNSQWELRGLTEPNAQEPTVVRATASTSAGVLARNVFSQDGSPDIARETGKTRYSELLRITGLAIPELQAECQRINRAAKTELDEVLARLNIEPLPTIATRAEDHVTKALSKLATTSFPTPDAANHAQQRLAEHARYVGILYRLVETPSSQAAADAATRAVALAAGLRTDAAFIQEIRQLHENLRVASTTLDERARALETLAAALVGSRLAKPEQERSGAVEPRVPGVPRALAGTWLQAGRSLRQSVDRLRVDSADVADRAWKDRLEEFIRAAEQALERIPFPELEEVVGHRPTPAEPIRSAPTRPDKKLFGDAGFDAVSDDLVLDPELESRVSETSRLLRDYSSELSRYSQSLLTAPLVQLEGSEAALLKAITRFELARRLKQPLDKAQAEMLSRLLSGPLEPLLTELIAALTRFEWYFHPFKMSVARGNVRLSGLATASEELDVRMLLNAGERAIVTIAWFLALHVLQPESDRKVLVLDDPFSPLDENNQAALIATLRSLTRLTRPDLLVLASHDRLVADGVEREFGALHGWPSTRARIRFSRAPDGTSRADGTPADSPEADYEGELTRLGIAGTSQLVLESD